MSDGFAGRLERALGARAPARRALPGLTSSAVLVPLFAPADEALPHVWLVRRPERMRAHGGQVALPGGKRDEADADLQMTALREASEEIGLAPDAARILGRLDDYVTITGYVITPFVAWVDASFVPAPQEHEVARAFAAPLDTFRVAGTPRPVIAGPFPYVAPSYLVDGEVVWGATASILRGLAALAWPR